MSIRIGVLGIGFVLQLASQPAEISGNRIRAHVKFLSSDLLEGRAVGTRGGDLATDYIATQFAVAGAVPAGDNGSYFQRVPMVGVTTGEDAQLTASKGAQSVQFRWRDDFVASTHRQKEREDIDAEAIFVGHGIDAPDYQWNDYKNVDVRGKIVVVFTNEPQPNNPDVFKGRALTYYGRWVYKYEEAVRKGALGCLIIHTTPTAGYGWEVVRNSWSKEDPQLQLEPGKHALAFAGWMTQDAGEKLLNIAGHTVPKLLAAADSRDFRPIPLGIRLRARLNSKIRPIESRNVAAVIPGTDPKAKDEYVIFSAHWDHLGIALPVNSDAIYNGAIDNATGCGILLETARAWGGLQNKPRRSVLFIAYTAEEAGLRGAEYYARHPIVRPSNTALDINYDALFPFGRTKDIIVDGAERTTIWPIVQEAAKRMEYTTRPSPRPEQGGYYRSDQLMLARIGIPGFRIQSGSEIYGKSPAYAAEVFTEYNTLHYHQPSDEFKEDWDFAGLEFAAKFGMIIGLDTAEMIAMPAWMKNDEFPTTRMDAMK
jgi:Zn-dependent M28 family amino/carboxypeptidase